MAHEFPCKLIVGDRAIGCGFDSPEDAFAVAEAAGAAIETVAPMRLTPAVVHHLAAAMRAAAAPSPPANGAAPQEVASETTAAAPAGT